MEVLERPLTVIAMVAHFILIGIILLIHDLSFLFGLGIGNCGHVCIMTYRVFPYLGIFSILLGIAILYRKKLAVNAAFVLYQCLLTFFLVKVAIEIVYTFTYGHYPNTYLLIFSYLSVYSFTLIMLTHALSKNQFFN